MQFPEHLQQFFITDFCRLVDHQHHFGVAGQARADFFIRRVRRKAAGVTHRRTDHAFALPELALRAPEAAEAEDREIHVHGKRAQQGRVVDEVFFRHAHRRFTARQGLFLSREHVFVHQDFRAQDHLSVLSVRLS
ncbi:hypothetical protein D3C78_1592260 [compost metagenome]